MNKFQQQLKKGWIEKLIGIFLFFVLDKKDFLMLNINQSLKTIVNLALLLQIHKFKQKIILSKKKNICIKWYNQYFKIQKLGMWRPKVNRPSRDIISFS